MTTDRSRSCAASRTRGSPLSASARSSITTAAAIRTLDEPPIIVGHSFGGLFTQILLDRGLGVAGVAIVPAPPKGVLPGVNAVRASLPVLMGWGAWRQIRMMTLDNFRWGWTHTLSDAEQRAAYEYVVPVPGRMFLQALLAPFTDVTKIDPRRRRAPLLIIAGQLDRTVEARMNRANFRMQQRAPATTEYREFPLDLRSAGLGGGRRFRSGLGAATA